MNDYVIFAACFAVSCVGLVAMFLYNVYRGVNDSLANAHIGSVYNFRYFQPMSGTCERYLAKVMNIRKLTNAEISRLNWSSDYRSCDKSFARSNTLVTCLMNDGEYRNFYAERSDMCKRSAAGDLMFRLGFAHMF
jgi:hypothetical protein